MNIGYDIDEGKSKAVIISNDEVEKKLNREVEAEKKRIYDRDFKIFQENYTGGRADFNMHFEFDGKQKKFVKKSDFIPELGDIEIPKLPTSKLLELPPAVTNPKLSRILQPSKPKQIKSAAPDLFAGIDEVILTHNQHLAPKPIAKPSLQPSTILKPIGQIPLRPVYAAERRSMSLIDRLSSMHKVDIQVQVNPIYKLTLPTNKFQHEVRYQAQQNSQYDIYEREPRDRASKSGFNKFKPNDKYKNDRFKGGDKFNKDKQGFHQKNDNWKRNDFRQLEDSKEDYREKYQNTYKNGSEKRFSENKQGYEFKKKFHKKRDRPNNYTDALYSDHRQHNANLGNGIAKPSLVRSVIEKDNTYPNNQNIPQYASMPQSMNRRDQKDYQKSIDNRFENQSNGSYMQSQYQQPPPPAYNLPPPPVSGYNAQSQYNQFNQSQFSQRNQPQFNQNPQYQSYPQQQYQQLSSHTVVDSVDLTDSPAKYPRNTYYEPENQRYDSNYQGGYQGAPMPHNMHMQQNRNMAGSVPVQHNLPIAQIPQIAIQQPVQVQQNVPAYQNMQTPQNIPNQPNGQIQREPAKSNNPFLSIIELESD